MKAYNDKQNKILKGLVNFQDKIATFLDPKLRIYIFFNGGWGWGAGY